MPQTRRYEEKKIVEGYGVTWIVITMENQHMPYCLLCIGNGIIKKESQTIKLSTSNLWSNNNWLVKANICDNLRMRYWSFVNEMHPRSWRLVVLLDEEWFSSPFFYCFCVQMKISFLEWILLNCVTISMTSQSSISCIINNLNFYAKRFVTICGVGGRTLSVGFHTFRFGWMNMRCGEEDPKWGASSLAWHSCQVKPCDWVCGESLCEVKIACFCNKSWVFLPFLTLLDSPMME